MLGIILVAIIQINRIQINRKHRKACTFQNCEQHQCRRKNLNVNHMRDDDILLLIGGEIRYKGLYAEMMILDRLQ